VAAGFKALALRRRKRYLSVKLTVLQRQLPVRRQQRLKYRQRLTRPPGLPAQPLSIPTPLQAYRPNTLCL